MNRKKVLFICVGNACRSQMAAAFARAYGSDVMEIESAGLSSAVRIPRETHQVMEEKGLSLDGQFPKDLEDVDVAGFDYAANMSGVPLVGLPVKRILEWRVRDPYGPDLDLHRAARDRIEGLVQKLVVDLRAGREPEEPVQDEGRRSVLRRLFGPRN